MKNPGRIVLLSNGQYGIMYHNEQRPEFGTKVCIHLFEDLKCQIPILDDNNQPKKVLKETMLIKKTVGFVD